MPRPPIVHHPNGSAIRKKRQRRREASPFAGQRTPAEGAVNTVASWSLEQRAAADESLRDELSKSGVSEVETVFAAVFYWALDVQKDAVDAFVEWAFGCVETALGTRLSDLPWATACTLAGLAVVSADQAVSRLTRVRAATATAVKLFLGEPRILLSRLAAEPLREVVVAAKLKYGLSVGLKPADEVVASVLRETFGRAPLVDGGVMWFAAPNVVRGRWIGLMRAGKHTLELLGGSAHGGSGPGASAQHIENPESGSGEGSGAAAAPAAPLGAGVAEVRDVDPFDSLEDAVVLVGGSRMATGMLPARVCYFGASHREHGRVAASAAHGHFRLPVGVPLAALPCRSSDRQYAFLSRRVFTPSQLPRAVIDAIRDGYTAADTADDIGADASLLAAFKLNQHWAAASKPTQTQARFVAEPFDGGSRPEQEAHEWLVTALTKATAADSAFSMGFDFESGDVAAPGSSGATGETVALAAFVESADGGEDAAGPAAPLAAISSATAGSRATDVEDTVAAPLSHAAESAMAGSVSACERVGSKHNKKRPKQPLRRNASAAETDSSSISSDSDSSTASSSSTCSARSTADAAIGQADADVEEGLDAPAAGDGSATGTWRGSKGYPGCDGQPCGPRIMRLVQTNAVLGQQVAALQSRVGQLETELRLHKRTSTTLRRHVKGLGSDAEVHAAVLQAALRKGKSSGEVASLLLGEHNESALRLVTGMGASAYDEAMHGAERRRRHRSRRAADAAAASPQSAFATSNVSAEQTEEPEALTSSSSCASSSVAESHGAAASSSGSAHKRGRDDIRSPGESSTGFAARSSAGTVLPGGAHSGSKRARNLDEADLGHGLSLQDMA